MNKTLTIAVVLAIASISLSGCWKSPAGPSIPTKTPTAYAVITATATFTATTVSDDQNDAYEPDNNTASETLIGTNGISQHHNMFDATDDYFKFNVTAGSVYQIRAVASTPGAYFDDFFLWDGNSSYELFSQSQDNATCVMTVYPSSTGVFHFRASRNNNYGPGKGYDIAVIKLPDTIPVSFNTAVDNQSLTFSFSGDGTWYGQGNIYKVGGGAVQSPHLTITQSASFSTQVTGPCTVSFKWKVSSESDKGFGAVDAIGFKVDGVYTASFGGEVDWADYSHSVTGAGVHTLSWNYSKDGTQTSGYDAGWVDDIQITH
jgi:hypothetical protein